MKKNVWIWNHYATDMYKNKGGRHYWFAKKLREEGFITTIFCANTYHNSNDYIETGKMKYKIEFVEGIPFVFVKTALTISNGLDRIINMFLFYYNIFFVAKKYAEVNGKPDVIIASSVHPLTMVAGIRIAKKMRIPCICEIRDLWPEAIFSFTSIKENSLLGKILLKGEYWIYKKADALIFTKEGDTDYIKEKKWDTKQGGNIDLNKAHYINNGVELETFIESIQKNIIDDEDLLKKTFNVVYVGAIRPVNNVGNILDTAHILKKEKDIQFLIYGDGSQREELEERVINENLTNVKIKGFVNKKHIPYILSKSAINILNYSATQYNWTRGNSSNKLFEYMASGKPVVSTVKMGYSIIAKYNCGIEIETDSASCLAQAILDIKNLPIEEYKILGENARTGVEEFDFNNLTSKLIHVIDLFD